MFHCRDAREHAHSSCAVTICMLNKLRLFLVSLQPSLFLAPLSEVRTHDFCMFGSMGVFHINAIPLRIHQITPDCCVVTWVHLNRQEETVYTVCPNQFSRHSLTVKALTVNISWLVGKIGKLFVTHTFFFFFFSFFFFLSFLPIPSSSVSEEDKELSKEYNSWRQK